MHEQDLGHLHELKTVEQIYEKYFPRSNLTIQVKYDDDIYPIKLIVTERELDTATEETYKISRKHNRVMCNKTAWGDRVQHYEKVQTFHQEQPWILQTS